MSDNNDNIVNDLLLNPVVDQNDQSRRRFISNNTYFTLSIYALIVIILGTISIKVIFNFNEVTSAITGLLQTFSSFVVAFFIAYIINPIVKLVDYYILQTVFRIKNKKVRVLISILFSYIFLITLIVLLLTYIIPEFAYSLADFSATLPDLFKDVINYANDFFARAEERFPQLNLTYVKEQVIDSLPQIFKTSTNLAATLISRLVNLSFSIITTTISIIISIVISTYMIADRHIIAKNCTKLVYTVLPVKTAESFCCTVKECNQILYNFIIGKALDSLIIGIITFIFMNILRLDYSLMISIIVGITNMIPYFGPFIGAIPGIVILLIINPIKGLIFVIMILAVQQFDGLYLGPKILGGSVGLSPLWVIFGITFGGAVMGPVGMFLGVPLVAVLAYLINKFTNYKLRNKHLDDEYFDRIVQCTVDELHGKQTSKNKGKFFAIFRSRKRNKPIETKK